VPDLVLDYHRRKVPIDHPDLSVTRAKLEYPTEGVSLTYLKAIEKLVEVRPYRGMAGYFGWVTLDSFADKAVQGYHRDNSGIAGRWVDTYNNYYVWLYSGRTTSGYYMAKVVNDVVTELGSEAVDIGAGRVFLLKFSISGSALKAYREDMATPKISAIDTTFTSSKFGSFAATTGYSYPNPFAMLLAPSSKLLPPAAVIEVGIEGSGTPEDPYRPSLSRALAEVSEVLNAPDFLRLEARRYEMLKAKGFTEEEISLLLGYIPQHQVDLNSVTWGGFEFSPQSPTNIITIHGDNPYSAGAVDRQVEFARRKGLRTFTPPRDYLEAVELYRKLESDFPHRIAGKDNFAFQALGWEVLDLFQNVDFYYGELLEHKTHYSQLKQVPDWELRRRLNELHEELSRVTVLTDERDKHIGKVKEVLKKGW